MILKLIRATVKPRCREAFLAQQRVWNEVMSRQAGFLGVQVATDPERPDEVQIVISVASREALERFMKGDHDLVERQTSIRELYSHLEVRVVDVVDGWGLADQVVGAVPRR